MKRRLLERLLVATAGVLLALILAEAGLRFVQARYLNPFVPDATVGFRLKPAFNGLYRWVPVRTDARGVRISRASLVSGGRTILFVGDSVTFGHDVRAEESYPELLQEELGPPWHVVNAAVPGYNLGQTLVRLRELLEGSKPSLVAYGLCLNDIEGAALPMRYEDIDPHHARRLRGGPLAWSALAGLVERRLERLALVSDRASEEGTFLRDADAVRDSLAVFDRQWEELEELQRASHVPLVVVIFPYREQIAEHPEWRAPQDLLRRKCAATALRCLDPWDVLMQHRAERLYLSSAHFTPAGHRLLAGWLAESLRPLLRG